MFQKPKPALEALIQFSGLQASCSPEYVCEHTLGMIEEFTNPFVLWSKIAGPTTEKETWLSLSVSASPDLLETKHSVMCAEPRSALRQINGQEVLGIRPVGAREIIEMTDVC